MPKVIKEKNIARMVMCLFIICENLEHHIKIWGDEIKYNDGWLSPHKKGLMTKMHNAIEKILSIYDESDVFLSYGARDKLIKNIENYIFVLAGRKSKQGKYKIFDFDDEKKTLPDGMLDSFFSFALTTEYADDHFKKSIEIENLTDDFNKFKKYLNQYQRFFEDEMIITVREG